MGQYATDESEAAPPPTAYGPWARIPSGMLATRASENAQVIPGWALAVLPLALAACSSTQTPLPQQPVVAAAVEVEARPADRVEAANRDFEKGDYARAVKGYEQVLAKDPENAAAKFNRAVALHRAGDLEGAKRAYHEILKEAPTDTGAALNLGVILKDSGDLEGAVSVYAKSLEGDEFNADLLNNLSVLYRHQKKYPKAISTVRKLLLRDKDNIDAYKNLALVYFDQKKYKLTQTILENALKMAKAQNKQDPDIYVDLGMLHLALEQNGKAMAAFKKAVEIEPAHVIANYNIGSLALGHRDYDLAARAYEIVTKAWQTDYEAAASLGYALQGQQRHEDAAKQLERAREIKLKSAVARAETAGSDDEQILLQLMVIWQSAADADKALSYADEYRKLKGIECKKEDFDGFCGRYNGIVLMKEMAQQPPEQEAPKPQGGKVDVFTEGPAEGGAGGEAAPGEASGGEAPQPAPEGQPPATAEEGSAAASP